MIEKGNARTRIVANETRKAAWGGGEKASKGRKFTLAIITTEGTLQTETEIELVTSDKEATGSDRKNVGRRQKLINAYTFKKKGRGEAEKDNEEITCEDVKENNEMENGPNRAMRGGRQREHE